MNIFMFHLKRNINSILIWSIGTLVLFFIFIMFYPTFTDSNADFNKLMENFPPEFKKAFGISEVDLSTIPGYLGFVLAFCQVCIGIQGANYGFSALSLEETQKTVDFLLTKPVTRESIYLQKLLACLVSLLITADIVVVGSYLMVLDVAKGKIVEIQTVWYMLLSMPLIQVYFFFIGMEISVLVKRIKNILPFSLGLVIGLYTLDAMGGTIGKGIIKYITPFSYFSGTYVAQHAGYDDKLLAIASGSTAIAILVSYLVYTNKDIHSA